MSTCVVTGGAGFLGSHLCDYLLAEGHRVVCVDNLETSTLENLEHIRGDDFLFLNHDVTEHIEIEGPVDFGLPPGRPRQPDRLPAPAAALAEGRLVRDASRARPREAQARAVSLASTSEVYGDPLVHPQPERYRGTSTRSALSFL